MRLLFVFSQPPHGTVNPQEAMDALLMGSAFTGCAVIFLNQGVLQLLDQQDTAQLGTSNFARAFGALGDYGVTSVFVLTSDLEGYHLTADDLVIPVTKISDNELPSLLSRYQQVINF